MTGSITIEWDAPDTSDDRIGTLYIHGEAFFTLKALRTVSRGLYLGEIAAVGETDEAWCDTIVADDIESAQRVTEDRARRLVREVVASYFQRGGVSDGETLSDNNAIDCGCTRCRQPPRRARSSRA